MNKFQRDGYAVEEKAFINNSIFVIHPYKFNGLYVFDKPEWNTVKELFVPSATEYLEKLSGNKEEFNLMFSVTPVPEFKHSVELVETDEYGSIYYSEEFNCELWLCPYLFRFYPEAPKTIYLQVK